MSNSKLFIPFAEGRAITFDLFGTLVDRSKIEKASDSGGVLDIAGMALLKDALTKKFHIVFVTDETDLGIIKKAVKMVTGDNSLSLPSISNINTYYRHPSEEGKVIKEEKQKEQKGICIPVSMRGKPGSTPLGQVIAGIPEAERGNRGRYPMIVLSSVAHDGEEQHSIRRLGGKEIPIIHVGTGKNRCHSVGQVEKQLLALFQEGIPPGERRHTVFGNEENNQEISVAVKWERHKEEVAKKAQEEQERQKEAENNGRKSKEEEDEEFDEDDEEGDEEELSEGEEFEEGQQVLGQSGSLVQEEPGSGRFLEEKGKNKGKSDKESDEQDLGRSGSPVLSQEVDYFYQIKNDVQEKLQGKRITIESIKAFLMGEGASWVTSLRDSKPSLSKEPGAIEGEMATQLLQVIESRELDGDRERGGPFFNRPRTISDRSEREEVSARRGPSSGGGFSFSSVGHSSALGDNEEGIPDGESKSGKAQGSPTKKAAHIPEDIEGNPWQNRDLVGKNFYDFCKALLPQGIPDGKWIDLIEGCRRGKRSPNMAESPVFNALEEACAKDQQKALFFVALKHHLAHAGDRDQWLQDMRTQAQKLQEDSLRPQPTQQFSSADRDEDGQEKERLRNLQKENERLQVVIGRLTKYNTSLSAQNDALGKEVKEKETRAKEIEEKAEKDRSKARETIEKIEREKKESSEAAKIENSRLQTELTSALEDNKEKVKELRTQGISLAEYGDIEGERKALQERIAAIEEHIKREEEKLGIQKKGNSPGKSPEKPQEPKRLEGILEELHKRLGTLEREVEEKKEEIKKEIERSKSDFENAQRVVKSAQEGKKQEEERRQEAEARVGEAYEARQVAQRDANAAREQLEGQLTQLQQENAALAEQVQAKAVEAAKMVEAKAPIEEKLAEREEERKGVESAISRLEEQAVGLEEQAEAIRILEEKVEEGVTVVGRVGHVVGKFVRVMDTLLKERNLKEGHPAIAAIQGDVAKVIDGCLATKAKQLGNKGTEKNAIGVKLVSYFSPSCAAIVSEAALKLYNELGSFDKAEEEKGHAGSKKKEKGNPKSKFAGEVRSQVVFTQQGMDIGYQKYLTKLPKLKDGEQKAKLVVNKGIALQARLEGVERSLFSRLELLQAQLKEERREKDKTQQQAEAGISAVKAVLAEEVETLRKKVQELEAQVRTLTEENGVLKGQVAAKDGEVRQLAEAMQLVGQVDDEQKSLHEQLQNLRKEIPNKKGKVGSPDKTPDPESPNSAVVKRHDSWVKKNKETAEELATAFKGYKSSSDEERGELEQQLRVVTEEKETLEAQVREREAGLTQLREKKATADEEVRKLRDQVREAEQGYKQGRLALQGQIDALAHEKEEGKSEIDHLTGQLAKNEAVHNTRLLQLGKELQEAKQARDTATEQLEEVRAELARLKEAQKGLTGSLEQMDTLQQQLQKRSEENGALTQQIAAVRAELAQAYAAKAQADRLAKERATQSSELSQDNAQLRNKVKKTEEKAAEEKIQYDAAGREAQEEIVRLGAEFKAREEALRARIAQLTEAQTASVEENKAEKAGLVQQLQQAQQELATLQEGHAVRIQELEAELKSVTEAKKTTNDRRQEESQGREKEKQKKMKERERADRLTVQLTEKVAESEQRQEQITLLTAAQSVLQARVEELDGIKGRLTVLQKEKAQWGQIREVHENKVAIAGEQVRVLEGQLHNMEALQGQVRETTEKEKEVLRQQITTARTEVAQAQQQQQIAEQSAHQIGQQVAVLQGQLHERTEANEQLATKIQEVEIRLATLQGKEADWGREKVELQQQARVAEGLQRELQGAQQAVTQAEGQRAQLQAQLEQVQAQQVQAVAAAEAGREVAEGRVREVVARVDNLARELETKAVEYAAQQARIVELERELGTLHRKAEQVDKVQEAFSLSTREVTALSEQKAVWERERRELEGRAHEAVWGAAQLEEKAGKENKELVEQIRQKGEELVRLQSELVRAQEAKVAADQASEERWRRLDPLQEELKKKGEEHRAVLQELQQLKGEQKAGEEKALGDKLGTIHQEELLRLQVLQLEEAVAQREYEYGELQRQLAERSTDLELENDQVQRQLEKALELEFEAQQELAALKSELELTKARLQEEEDARENAENRQALAEAREAKALDINDIHQQRAILAEEKVAAFADQNEELIGELFAAEQSNEELVQQLEQLRADLEEQRRQGEEANKTREREQETKEEEELERLSTQASLEDALEDVGRLQRQVTGLGQQLGQATEAKGAAERREQEAGQAAGKAAAVAMQIGKEKEAAARKAEEEIKRVQDEKAVVDQQVVAQHTHIQELSEQLDEEKEKAKEQLEELKDTFDGQVEELRDKVDEQLEELQEQLQEQSEENEQLQQDNKELAEDVIDKQEQITKLQGQLEELQEKAGAYERIKDEVVRTEERLAGKGSRPGTIPEIKGGRDDVGAGHPVGQEESEGAGSRPAASLYPIPRVPMGDAALRDVGEDRNNPGPFDENESGGIGVLSSSSSGSLSGSAPSLAFSSPSFSSPLSSSSGPGLEGIGAASGAAGGGEALHPAAPESTPPTADKEGQGSGAEGEASPPATPVPVVPDPMVDPGPPATSLKPGKGKGYDNRAEQKALAEARAERDKAKREHERLLKEKTRLEEEAERTINEDEEDEEKEEAKLEPKDKRTGRGRLDWASAGGGPGAGGGSGGSGSGSGGGTPGAGVPGKEPELLPEPDFNKELLRSGEAPATGTPQGTALGFAVFAGVGFGFAALLTGGLPFLPVLLAVGASSIAGYFSKEAQDTLGMNVDQKRRQESLKNEVPEWAQNYIKQPDMKVAAGATALSGLGVGAFTLGVATLPLTAVIAVPLAVCLFALMATMVNSKATGAEDLVDKAAANRKEVKSWGERVRSPSPAPGMEMEQGGVRD